VKNAGKQKGGHQGLVARVAALEALCFSA
jgi:hypothetical protein